MRCILHIGTRKTGSTSIQYYMKDNAEALLKQGVLYPQKIAPNGFQLAVATDPRMVLWYYLGRENIKTKAEVEAFAAEVKNKLRKEIAESRPETVIFSSEDLSFFINDDQTASIKAFLDDLGFSEYDIICYIRRQDRYVVSDITTALVNGGQPFTLQGNPEIVPHLNYKRLIDAWATAFGRNAVNIHVFEPSKMVHGDLLADFCAFAGVDDTGFVPASADNSSITAAAQAFLRVVNEKYPAFLPSGEFNEKRGQIGRILSENFGGKPPLPARAEAEAFYEHFRASNEELRRVYFPEQEHPVFNEDFSTYPEIGEEVSLTFRDGAELGAALWGEMQSEISGIRNENRELRRQLRQAGIKPQKLSA